MKILGLTLTKDKTHETLVDFALSLFDQVEIKNVNLYGLQSLVCEKLIKNIPEFSLIIMKTDANYNYSAELLKVISDSKIPVLLFINNDSILSNNLNVCGTIKISINSVKFNERGELKNTTKRLELIRLVNKLSFDTLNIRSNNKFSCGITRPTYYVGDSIGY